MTKTSASAKELLKQSRQKKASSVFAKAAADAEVIPLRTKTQYPFYIEARTIHLLRAIAEVDGISVQELLRKTMDEMVELRIYNKRNRKSSASSKT